MGFSGAYYHVDFDVVSFFGSTELKAQMAWKDNVSHALYRFSFSDSHCVSRGLNNGEC